MKHVTPMLCRRRSHWFVAAFAALFLLPHAPKAEAKAEEPARPLFGAYLAGVHALTLRDYGAADAWLTRAWQADPNAPQITTRTLLAALLNGRFAEASLLSPHEIEREPDNAAARLVRLIEEMKAGKDEAALASAEKLPRAGIHRFVRPLALAWAQAGVKNFDGALTALKAFDQFEDFSPLKFFEEGLIDDYAGRALKAEAHFKSALAATGTLNWRLTEAVATFYLEHGRKTEAEALYRRFLKASGESDFARSLLANPPAASPGPIVPSPAKGFAEALFDLASVFDAAQTRGLALMYTRLSLALDPASEAPKLLLADILSTEGHPRQSLAVLAQVPSTSRYSWSARLRAAADLDAAGESAKAIALLEGMAAAEPLWTGAPIELGDLLRSAKRFADAAKAYREAIGRLEASGAAVPWSLDYSFGIALDRSGHWRQAEKALLAALKLKPNEPFVLNYLGYSWVNRGEKLRRGLKILEKAVSLRPDDGYIIDSLGWAHYHLGDYVAAVKYLEKATELVPDDPTINDHLGDAYWRDGRPREARFAWRQALEFGPKKSRIKPIEAKLERGLGPAGGG